MRNSSKVILICVLLFCVCGLVIHKAIRSSVKKPEGHVFVLAGIFKEASLSDNKIQRQVTDKIELSKILVEVNHLKNGIKSNQIDLDKSSNVLKIMLVNNKIDDPVLILLYKVNDKYYFEVPNEELYEVKTEVYNKINNILYKDVNEVRYSQIRNDVNQVMEKYQYLKHPTCSLNDSINKIPSEELIKEAKMDKSIFLDVDGTSYCNTITFASCISTNKWLFKTYLKCNSYTDPLFVDWNE